MAKVSVIIPLYNKGSLVARAIDSILAQTFQDFELVIVDDGSTDNGPEYVKKYTDSRIRMYAQPNAGPGAARNRGVKEASSELIAFLDADDEFSPDFLKVSVRNLVSNPDCMLSVVNHFRSDKKILATEMHPCDIGIETGAWRLAPDAAAPYIWGSLVFMQTWVVVCRRDVYLKYGGSYEHRCTYGEDQYLWLQILLNCRIYRDTTPLTWYHTEDSELYGPNRKTNYPLYPYLVEPEPVRRNCPSEYRVALENLFAYTAAEFYLIFAWQKDAATLRYLLNEYPSLTQWRKDWLLLLIKAYVKAAMPWLIAPTRALRRVFARH